MPSWRCRSSSQSADTNAATIPHRTGDVFRTVPGSFPPVVLRTYRTMSAGFPSVSSPEPSDDHLALLHTDISFFSGLKRRSCYFQVQFLLFPMWLCKRASRIKRHSPGPSVPLWVRRPATGEEDSIACPIPLFLVLPLHARSAVALKRSKTVETCKKTQSSSPNLDRRRRTSRDSIPTFPDSSQQSHELYPRGSHCEQLYTREENLQAGALRQPW